MTHQSPDFIQYFVDFDVIGGSAVSSNSRLLIQDDEVFCVRDVKNVRGASIESDSEPLENHLFDVGKGPSQKRPVAEIGMILSGVNL